MCCCFFCHYMFINLPHFVSFYSLLLLRHNFPTEIIKISSNLVSWIEDTHTHTHNPECSMMIAIQIHFMIFKLNRYSENKSRQLHEIDFLSLHPCCWKALWLKADFLRTADTRSGPSCSNNSVFACDIMCEWFLRCLGESGLVSRSHTSLARDLYADGNTKGTGESRGWTILHTWHYLVALEPHTHYSETLCEQYSSAFKSTSSFLITIIALNVHTSQAAY